MDPDEQKEVFIGPAIVATANAMRALDAPVRYPLLLSRYTWVQNITSALRLSSFSSFIVTIEHIIGVLIITPILLIRRGKSHFISLLKDFQNRERISIAFVSLGSGLGLYFFLISFALGNPTVAILLQKTQPLITLLVAMILLKERPTKFYYIAVFFSIIGIFLIAFEDPFRITFSFEALAALCSIIAAVFWGSNTVFGRILTEKADYWDITTFRYIGGALILIFFNIIVLAYTPDNFNALGESFTTFPRFFETNFGIPMLGIICITYSAILTGGIIPLALYYFGLRWSKASVSGLAELAFPLLAIFINFIFLGFTLSLTQIIGALILFGVVTTLSYINTKEYEQEKKENSVDLKD
ncbi:MAG: EamA family transporter [Candidatus Heimdallarchaeota archaeon]|nr:MAG: EamA family transporter [Candidatus Heimdallarchaeota archaeon]